MRVSSGVPGFDALVQGGLPKDSAVVVQGPAGREKDAFLLQFVVQGLRRGGAALVVLSSMSPAKYRQELREAGIDVDRAIAENRLKFVDWFTYKENPVQDVEEDGPVFRASIDLANVGIAISHAIAALPREGEKRAVLEILSPALGMYDLPAVYGFAQSTKAKLERFGFTALVALEKEMHDERTLSSIHQPFDGVVDFERVREGDEILRKMAVLSLVGTTPESKYVPLVLGEDRILRVSTAPIRERTLVRQEELIKSDPRNPKLWLATARNLQAMGDATRALKCVDAALNLDPKDEEARRFKAEVLDALGRKEEADQIRARGGVSVEPAEAPVEPKRKEDGPTRILDLLEGRLQRDARDPDALFALAAVLAGANDLYGAVAVLDKLAEIDETYPGLWTLKAKLHTRLGEIEKAEAALVRESASAPTPPRAEDPSARLLRLAEERLRRNPRDPDALFSTAAVLAKANDLLGAVALLEKLAEIDEAYPGLWILKTQLHARRGELEKAQESRARRLEVEARLARREAEAKPAPTPETAHFCPSCGFSVGADDSVCGSCGVVFGDSHEQGRAAQRKPKRETIADRVPTKKPEPGIPALPSPAPVPAARSEVERGRRPEPGRAVPRPELPRRGLTNGLGKEGTRGLGRTNGFANGSRPARAGRTNGLTNGARGRTNGLVNGLRSDSLRLSDGLTNGMGFTNGLGSSRIAREHRLARWKVYLIPTIAVALLLIPILGPESSQTGIVVDGNTADWDSARIVAQGRSSSANPNADIVRMGAVADDQTLSFLVDVAGEALMGGGSPATTDGVHVFLDADENPATGYPVDSLGADRLIEVWGHGGGVDGVSVRTWTGGPGSQDWRDWELSGSAVAAAAGPHLEIQALWPAIADERTRVVAAVHARAFDASHDTSDGVLNSEGGSLRVVQEPVVADVIPVPAAAMLLRLEVTAQGGDATISGLGVTLTGRAGQLAASAIRLADQDGLLIDERIPVGPRIDFQFAPRRIATSTSQQLFMIADVLPFGGETFGAIVTDASDVLANVPVSVRRARSPRDVGYIAFVPPGPRVDGGFGEWATSLPDPPGDAGLADVDLTSFDARFSGNESYFYAAVGGRILSGTWVPQGNRVVSVPTPPVMDADRDTVPDAVDPYPYDFNNDLVDDVLSGGDVDADGLLDYQRGGADWWLNTTIPATFPAPYGNRTVNVYVGPWEPPFQTRDDVLRVFVDLDNVSWTGYALAGLGADRLVEISGTEGRLRTTDFFTFGGSYPGQWSWVPMSQATAVIAFGQMEFSVAENLSATGARMFVEARGPLGANDDMAGTRGTRGNLVASESRGAGSSFDVARSPILEALRADNAPSTGSSQAAARSAPSPPQVLDVAGNDRFWLRDTSHATENSCTSNKVASSTQGAGAAKTVTLSPGQAACWYLDATTKTDVTAGTWESLLDVSDGVKVASGSFNIGTGAPGSTTQVTGTGFQPKAVLFWWDGTNSQADIVGGLLVHKRGFGVAVSTTDRRAIFSQAIDAADPTTTDAGHHDAAAIGRLSNAGAIDALADLQSMDANGFTLVIDDDFPTDTRIHYLALGGSDLTNVASGMFTESAATFPQVGGSATSSRSTNAIDDVVTLPASVASGDLVIVFHHSLGTGTRTFPSPWVEIKDVAILSTFNMGIAYLIASGGETSVTVTKSASQRFSALAIRITAASWHGTTPPEITAGVTGQNANPDPDAITASWGSANNLFIAVNSIENDGGGQSTTAYPTNYVSNQLQSPDAGGPRGAIATRELAASNDNPGTFTVSVGDERWWAGTIVVRPAATISQDVTTVGFQPDAVILFSAMIGADPPGVAVDSTMMLGFAAGSTPTDAVWAGGADDNAATAQAVTYSRSGESIALFDSGLTTTDGRAEVSSWLSNGFRVDWLERAGSRRIHYLALKGGHYLVGDLLTRTDTTTPIIESGFGFGPKAALLFSHGNSTSTQDTVQDHDSWSLGAFTSPTARAAHASWDEDNTAAADVTAGVEHDEVYINIGTTEAMEGLMDVQSVDSGGFTLIMDDADPSQAFVGYLAIGGPEYDVQMQVWNKDTDSVRSTVISCLDQTTKGDDVSCSAAVPTQTIAANEVVRVRIAHSSGAGTVSIEYDDADATGDSRVTIPQYTAWQSTLIDSHSHAVSTQYNQQRKVVRAGDVSGDTACDATNSDGCWYSVYHDRAGSVEADFKDGTSVAVPASIGLLESLVPNRAFGDNLIVAVVQFDNTGAAARTISAGNLELRRGTSTTDPLISETQLTISVPADGGMGDGMFAVLVGKDASAPGLSKYGVFGAADATGLSAEVKIVMISGLASTNSVFADGGSVALSTSATALVSQSTTFAAASSSLPNIIVAVVQVDETSGQVDIDTPTGIEVRRDSTSLRGIEYKMTITDSSSSPDGVFAMLVAADAAAGANPTYDVRAVNANGASSTANAEAKLLVFRGLAATDTDTASVSILTSRTQIGTRTTTFAAGDDVILGSMQINSPSTARTYAAAANDVRLLGAGSGSSNQFADVIGPLGGDLQVSTGSFTISGAAGTVITVTTGFRPKAYFLWTNGRDAATDESGSDTMHWRGFGVGISTTDRRTVCSESESTMATSATWVLERSDAVMCGLDNQGGTDMLDGLLDHNAMISTGFEVLVDSAEPEEFQSSNMRVHYLALGGAELANVVSGEFTESGTTGNQDVTVGFQPDAVVLFSGMITGSPSDGQADSTLSIGFAAGSGNPTDVVWAGASNNGAADSQTITYSRTGESIALFDTAIAVTNARAEVDAWNSNGFSLDWAERAGSRRIHYVALKGARYAVGDMLTSTNTSQFSETGLPWSPSAGLFLSHNNATSTADTIQNHDQWSMGSVTTASARRTSCLIDEDAQATTDIGTAVEHDELYCNLDTTPATEGLMDIVSVNSDGWTFVMDDVDPAQAFVGYIAFAPGPATGASMFEAFIHKVSTISANPSYEGAATAPSTGSSGELKLLAIHIKNTGTDGDDRIILRRSSDTSGSTWGTPIILASGNSGDSPLLYSYDSAEPSIAFDASGYLHVIWVSASSSGDQSTLNRVRYTKTTVTNATQSELASSGNWESVRTVDDASLGYMPTVSTDTSNNPHLAWSGSKTGGTVYSQNKAGGTWRSTVSWGSSYTGISVDISPVNNYVALARAYVTPDAVIGYRSSTGGGVNIPKTRTWDGSQWGSETTQSTTGSPIRDAEIAWSPTVADTRIIVTLSDDGWLDAYVCTPSCSVTNNIGQVWTSSPSSDAIYYDIEYEQVSGEALLVYGIVSTDVARDIAYKTYTSSGWGGEQYLNDTDPLNNDIQYNQIRLAAKAGSDSIGLIGGDSTNSDANAWIWDGSAFGNFWAITNTTIALGGEVVAIAYERASGDLLALAWGDTGTPDPNFYWSQYTTSWSTPTTFNCASDNAGYVVLKPNPVPTANDMIVGSTDSYTTNLNLHTCYWDGNSFSNKVNHDAAIDTEFERVFDFAWEGSGSKGLLVYGTTSGQITYRTFTAPNTWGTATDVAYGSNTKRWIQARTNPLPVTGGAKILGAVMENSDNDLGAFSWDGATFAVIGDTTFTADTGTGTYESFALEYSPLGHEVQHTVCKNLNSSQCDASGEFTKWDGNPGYDIVAFAERGGYPSLVTTYESNGDLWIGYAKDVDGSTRAIYVRFLNYPSGGWATAESAERVSGALFTRPSIGVDRNNVVQALYVRTDGPQLYFRNRDGNSWGADTAASTETLTLGSKVAGSFPTDISTQNAVYVRYRENADEIGATGYRSGTGNGVNYPKQLDWTGTAWGTPETELTTAGAAVENVRVIWDTSTDSTLFWILVNTGANLHAYKCTNVDTCSKEDVDPSSGNDYAVTQAVGTAPERHWDAAIEASSGELLLTYDNPAAVSDDLCYRTRTSGGSGSWSSETCFNHAWVNTTNPSFANIVLANNPGSNRIALGAFDTTNDDFVLGMWDGTAWLTGAHQVASSQGVTLTNGWGGSVYAEDSADEFVAYSGNGAESARECEWTSSGGWEATTSCISFDPETTTLNDVKVFSEGGSRDGSNDVLVCHSNDINDPTCFEWAGVSGIGGGREGTNELTTNDGSGATIALPVDADWSPDQSGTEDALAVYYTTSGSLNYRTYDETANTWAGSTFTSAGSHLWVQVVGTEKAINAVKAHVVTSNSNNDILAYRWTGGSAPGNEQSITGDATDQTYAHWDLAFQDSSNQHIDIRHQWSGVPSGTTYTLKVKGYRVDENLNVQVLTPPSDWNIRLTISATTNTLYTYTLTSSEYNSGGPAIRFTDPSGADSVQSDFYIDLSLVMTDHTYVYVANTADNPTILVRSPNDATYGTDTGGMYWKVTTSETYFFGYFPTYIPEFEALVIPILGIAFLAWVRRRRILKGRAVKPAEPTGAGVPRS